MRELVSKRLRHVLCEILLLTALAVVVTGCAGNLASQNSYVDHNLDYPYWEW